MKRALQIGFIVTFFGILLLPVLGFQNQDAKSVRLEKRNLAALPSFSDAVEKKNFSITKELDAYFSDHIGFRASLVNFANTLKVKLFGVSSSENVIVGSDGWLFFSTPGTEIDPIADFMGTSSFTQDALYCKTAFLAEMQAECEKVGAEFYVIIGPSKASIYGDAYLPDCFLPGAAYTRTDMLVDYIRAHSSITVIYPKEALLANRESYLLYYQHDSHWSGLGAYLAYREWAMARSGVMLPALSECEMYDMTDVPGDMLGMLAVTMPEKTYQFVKRPNVASYTLKALSDMEEEHLESAGENSNGESLLLFRDSFAESLLPYILPDFTRADIIWKHAKRTDFHWIAEKRPNVVIYETVERCCPYIEE